MPTKRWFSVLILVITIAYFTGCGGSTFNVQNPGPPPQQSISIAFQTPPPTAILINSQPSLTAVVTNDQTNAGVDWRLTCVNQSITSCGSLSSMHSGSGEAITFTPPASFIGNSTNVTIIAYSTFDNTKNIQAPITITAFGTVLNGTYVFQASGSDVSGFPYEIAGVVILDGTGDSCTGYINSGQQTINTVASGSVTTPISGSSGSPCVPGPSSYFVGTDGRGSIIVATTDQNNNPVTETFSLVVLTNSSALIAEDDSVGSATGTLELQDPNAAGTTPIGGYAFAASGTDSLGTGIAFGGVANFDSQGNIISTASLLDIEYQGNPTFYIECEGKASFGGTVSSPGPFGAVIFTLNAPRCFSSSTILLTGYIVDATHIRLVETDAGFLTSGLAVSQGSAAGTFTPASLAGQYLFGVRGLDLASSSPSTLTSMNAINADGQGNITIGATDTFLLSLGAQISDQFTASYEIDSKMIGRVRTSHFKFDDKHFPTYTPIMTLYLTGKATPPLVLFGSAGAYPALGTGTAYLQAPNPQSLSFGNGEIYGLSFTQQNGSENDGSGQLTATLNQGAAGASLSGTVDETANGFGAPVPLTAAAACPQGSASCPDSFGRFVASTFVPNQTSAAVSYYLVDQDDAFFVETDLLSSSQVGLGYITKRCDVTTSGACEAAAKSLPRYVPKRSRSLRQRTK